MRCKLSDYCEYAKEKIEISKLTERNYISTDNMIPYRGGITIASSIPNVSKTQAYEKGDVLVSNIRPYFKKIWLAENSGGCSNDVLVFRATKCCDSSFLYYLLSSDSFFDYAMASSKGTKMPRGDKASIMNYEVPVFPLSYQKKIVTVLSAIDKKIRINKQINDNLFANLLVFDIAFSMHEMVSYKYHH